MIPEKCRIFRSEKNIVLKENNKTIRIDNADLSNLETIRVDGCVITNKTACDFAVLNTDCGALIELKGCNVERAIQQLVETHDYFKSARPSHTIKRGYIISSRVPSFPTSMRKLEETFRKTKMKINMKTRILEISSSAIFGS